MHTVIKYLEVEEKSDQELGESSQSLGDFPLTKPSRWPSGKTPFLTFPSIIQALLKTFYGLFFVFFLSCFEDQFAETYTVTRVTLMFQARVHRLQFWIPGSKSEGSVVKESRAVARRLAPLHSEAAALESLSLQGRLVFPRLAQGQMRSNTITLVKSLSMTEPQFFLLE